MRGRRIEAQDPPHEERALQGFNPRDGRLLLVHNPQEVGREQLALSCSTDDGRSWGAPRLIEDSAGEFSYPFALQAQDGRIHLLYTEQRTHIVHLQIDPDELQTTL